MEKKIIAIIGGTGNEGKGLAYRWGKAGYPIIIGSRQEQKGIAAAKEVNSLSKNSIPVSGMENGAAAFSADIIVITVPFTAHKPTLESIKEGAAGKIVIDVSVPLVPPKVTKVQMPTSGSALQETKEILGEMVKVASAFQNISHEHLLNDEEIGCDVLVCGEGREVRETVLQLVEDAGMVGWDAGPIENSAVVEGLTSILIGINKKHGVNSSGIQITGVTRS